MLPSHCLLLTAFLLIAPAALAQNVTVLSGGAATLENGGTMDLSGSLTVDGTFTPGTSTTVRFSGSGTITSDSKVAFRTLVIALPAATDRVLLAANLSIADLLDVQQGDVDLGGFVIDLGATGRLQEAPGHTVRGERGYVEATRTLSPPPGTDASIAGLGLAIASSTDLGQTILRRGHAVQSDPATGNQGIARYFDILPTTNAGLDATLLLFYDESELNGLDETTLLLYRFDDEGTTWTEEGGTANPSSNHVRLDGIDAFSRWTLASSSAPLPVELTAFDAVADGSNVLLRWTTASETNNAGFEVQVLGKSEEENERAKDAVRDDAWQVLGWVDGRGTTVEAQHYTYRVKALAAGTHRFRLRQIDFDGTFDYSPEVEVSVAVPGEYHLAPAYPNPFNPQTAFSLGVAQAQSVQVAAYDALGRRVAVLYDGPMTAHQTRSFVFEASSLPSGLYVIRAVGERFVATQPIVLAK